MHENVKNAKDLGAGTIFIAIGLIYGLQTWYELPIGSAFNMGPGYFPLILSAMLILFGLAIGVRGFLLAAETPFGTIPWRGLFMLSLATVFFAMTIEQLGMVISVFVTSLLACFANPHVRIGRAVLTSLGIAVFCTAVFAFGVRLPIPAFGDWLSF